MKQYLIIWDFDGTILPADPYDSEQTLLLARLAAAEENTSFIRRLVARTVVYADKKQWLGASFKKYYLWLLKDTPVGALDRVAETLAKKITSADRLIYRQLHAKGYRMMVLSCGTFDLIERTLYLADLKNCFTVIKGNQFETQDNRISGMTFRMLTPQDKLTYIRDRGMAPETIIAVGDGYTDLPLLDWAGIPVMMDRTGRNKNRFARRRYHFIASVADIIEVISKQRQGGQAAPEADKPQFGHDNATG